MVKEGQSFFDVQLRVLRKSFVVNKKLLKIGGLDFIFYLLFVTSFYIWMYFFGREQTNLKNTYDLTSLLSMSASQIGSVNDAVISLAIFLAVSLFIFVLTSFLLSSFFKGKIYALLLDKKFSFKQFVKLFFFNLLFYFLVILLSAYFAFTKMFAIFFFIFGVAFYFHTLFLYFYSLQEFVGKGLAQAFKFGLRIHYFLLFFLVAGGIFAILEFGVGYLRLLPIGLFATLLSTLLVFLFVLWVRNYFFEVIRGNVKY